MTLQQPTAALVRSTLDEYAGDAKFFGAESAVRMVFAEWPTNTILREVIVKVVVLNRLYSTRIENVWGVAQHIIESKIDDSLLQGDVNLVQRVAAVKHHKRYELSFASKYCSWHQPDSYQIYDGNVDNVLWRYKNKFQFSRFFRYELKDYPRFMDICNEFQAFFGLSGFTRKEIDKFLWISGC